MKKLLIIVILFLFLVCGCGKKEETLIGISRINESVICEEYCVLDLKVISTKILEDIELESLNVNTDYDYSIEASKKEIKIADAMEKKIYSYDLSIKVFNPVNITNIDLIIDEENYNFNIGSFKCLEKTNSSSNHIECFSTITNDLNKGTINHKINILNKADKQVFITEVKLESGDENIIVCKNLKDKVIIDNKEKEMANCYVSINEDLYNLSYVLKIGYVYKGDFYEYLYNVKDSGYVESVSNIGTSIVVDEACFVLKE